MVSSSYRATGYQATGTARHLLRSRLGYLGALSALMAIAVAELAFVFERGHGDTFSSFADALLWALAVVVAMQGDPVPHSAAGRLVMLAGFAVGLILVASVAGAVGAFLVDDRHERASAESDD